MVDPTLSPRALRRIWSPLPPSTRRRLIAQLVFLLRATEPGAIAAFDGDYATTTVAIGENDPLQVAAQATYCCASQRPLARAASVQNGQARRRAECNQVFGPARAQSGVGRAAAG